VAFLFGRKRNRDAAPRFFMKTTAAHIPTARGYQVNAIISYSKKSPPRICVIDGQGGGIGATIIRQIKGAFGENVEVLALGTNAIATANMIKAGANRGATGENAICRTVFQVSCIVGTLAIAWPNAMMGEVTSKMAEAVTESPAIKILLPLFQEHAIVVGLTHEPLPHLVQELVETHIKEVLAHV